MDSEIQLSLRKVFEEVKAALGPPFTSWRIAPAEPDLRIDKGYPALCYWLYDHNGKPYAFSFPDRPSESNLDWLKRELQEKLLELLKSPTQE